MVRKTSSTPDPQAQDAGAQGSPHPIWQAGLGAFAKAQEEGGRMFEALVREGSAIQRRTQVAAEEKMAEAAERMAAMAGDLSGRAQGQWGKLEGIFEERVSQALQRLGVPTAAEVKALHARVADLEQQLAAGAAPAKKAAARPAAKPATKPARKSPARRSAPRTASNSGE